MRSAVVVLAVLLVAHVPASFAAERGPGRALAAHRTGPVRVDGHALADDGGPFLGLGASYFTALWRCKHDRPRLEADLAFLARQGFNYYRMLSMVGYYPAWEGLEIAPVPFTTRDDRRVEAWPDYWQQLRDLIDLAYDRHGLRTQVTVFADAQLMPNKGARVEHMRKLLADVVRGREYKVIMIEVANEAWQNGFPGDEGVADLREFAAYLAERTEVPVAITSNHDWPELGSAKGFEQVYADSAADLATWHFSRDRRTDGGWKPVYDCWDFGLRRGLPPAVSNEPIGPGSSVNAEREPIRLVAAAAFAYAAKLPAYVFHSEAGVFGKTRFQDTPAVDRFGHVLRLLPADLPNWERNDGKEAGAPFTAFAGGRPNAYWPEVDGARDGCVRNTGSRRGERFVCVPIGIRPGGLQLEARQALEFTAHDPLTGEVVKAAAMRRGERVTLPAGPGALLVLGRVRPAEGDDGGRGDRPWPRHTIEAGLLGADGARLADANGDGRPDLVVGWEQSGVVAAYVNPGPARAKQPWPKVHFPGIGDVEDAVFVDLDADGAVDVVSSCEGRTRRVFVHWAPRDKADYLDASKWSVGAFPAAAGVGQWMFCLPLQLDGREGTDLVVGSKGKNASVSWLQAPADPRDLAGWTLHRLSDAGWVMSIVGRDMDGDGDDDLLISDRRGPLRGVRWLEHPGAAAAAAGRGGPWRSHTVGAAGEEVLFLDAADADGDGLEDVAVAQPGRCLLLRRADRTGLRWQPHPIPLPGRVGGGKAVSLGDLDRDGRADLVLTCEGAGGGRSGVVWLGSAGGLTPGPWTRHEVSGPEGVKYDLAPLLDLDGDGDLDVITTEENDNAGAGGLGVVWYENPVR